MELDCIRLVCTNGQEYIIVNDEKRTFDEVLLYFDKNIFGKNYFALQSKDHDPLFIKNDKVFSVQKVSKTIIGAQTRTWRLV